MNELTKKLLTLGEAEVAGLYKTVFSTVEGKLVLEDLKNRCHAYTTTLQDRSEGMIYFNEGMRTVVLHIEGQVNYEKYEEPI